jgi:hypothetical protein
MVTALAVAAGPAGMVGGQAIDLGSVGQKLDRHALEYMHRHKTGALIEAAVHLGALASGRAEATQLAALKTYAQAIGWRPGAGRHSRCESDTATLGKRQGADIARDKPTYPALLGRRPRPMPLNCAIRPWPPCDLTQRPSHCGTWRGISSNAATDNRGHCSRISAKFGALRAVCDAW